MKILVPIDFHPTSLAAYKYAVNFAQETDNEITLIHIINGSFNSNKALSYEPLKEMENEIRERLAIFSKSITSIKGIDYEAIELVVRFGIPGFTVADYAVDNEMDLVIMGTRDKHGFFDRIMGSCSSILVRAASCPVILIHKDIDFETISKIAFAFDNPEDISDSLGKLKGFNESVKAHVTFIHMLEAKELKTMNFSVSDTEAGVLDNILKETEYAVEILDHGKLSEKIEQYCVEQGINLLAMTHRKEGVFKGMFRGHDSVKVAQHLHLPVLVFHEQ